mgnify:CR=1 FL=1
MEKLKVGIAGYGVVGRRRRNFIDQHPLFETVAVCDQLFSENETDHDGVKAFKNYEKLLEQDLDVLFVCLPNFLAAQVTVSGLQKKLHVFCEKPPGRNVQDIQNVIDVEKQYPELVLKYGFNHRYHDSVTKALEIIQSGELGSIINLRGVYGKSRVVPFDGGWRSERELSGGGILLDQGIHMVDLLRLFAGEFSEVKSFVSNDYWKHDVEDNAYALLRNTDGIVAMIHSSATHWEHHFSLSISLTQGYLKLSGLLTGSKSYGEEQLLKGKRVEDSNGTLKEEKFKFLNDHSWKSEIEEFGNAIAKKGRILNGTSLDSLRTMELVYKIYAADDEWQAKFK